MADEQKKIVVIDDNPDVGSFCKDLLESEGYAVRTFVKTDDGLASIRDDKPDLVILDVMVEEVDSGFQTARKLAADDGELPLIMLSGISEASQGVFDTHSLPVKGMLDKPIDPGRLLEAVQRIIG